jgi:hypothetical protein
MNVLKEQPMFKLQIPQASAKIVCPDGRILTVEVRSVGPADADAMLKLNVRNRKVTLKNVALWVAAMERGEWMLNGETIIFDEDGNLFQGQHRLLAIKKSGKTIDVLIVRGIRRDAFKTLDSGRKRSIPDTLDINGEKNVNVLAAALRAVSFLVGQHPLNTALTTTQSEKLLAEHPTARFWSSLHASTTKKFMPSLFAGVLTVAAERYGHDPIKRFYDQVATGEGLKSTDPAYLLRERFRDRARSDVVMYQHAIAYCIKAMNAYTQGHTLKLLRLTANESMPVLL